MLDVRDGTSSTTPPADERLPLAELGRVAYFRPDTLPVDFQAELMVTRHYTPRGYGFTFTNGIQASLVEVDTDTGFVKLLKHWCVEDCGTIINPQLVDEQIRGGIVQGIGAALFEQCLYDEPGSCSTATWPTIWCRWRARCRTSTVGHVVTPTADFELGAKGAGEAGTAGAPAAVMNAINDALRPLGATPLTACRSRRRGCCGRWGRCDHYAPSCRLVPAVPLRRAPFSKAGPRGCSGR